MKVTHSIRGRASLRRNIMKKSPLLGAVCAVLFTFTTLLANAALVDNGGGLIYDDVLDITWAQPDINRPWDEANTWASGLTLGGMSGWRLPYISVAAGAGPFSGMPVLCNEVSELACRDNELGYMFYYNLGGSFGVPIGNSLDPDLGLFPTLQSDDYWSGTELDFSYAWEYNFGGGYDLYGPKDDEWRSWAVHAGDVVPVPAAVWLFGSGLMGLLGLARRKRRHLMIR